jgi:hypothetical protein
MWFDILKWEEILKRKIFEGEVPKWLEEYADMEESDSVEIEGFRVFGHAMKRMMGFDESNDPRPLDGGFYFKNMLVKFENTLNMKYTPFAGMKVGYQFSLIANGYVWAVQKDSEDNYSIVSYIGNKDNIKSNKKLFDLGFVDSDGPELARSREELIAARKIEKPVKEKEYSASKVEEVIMGDPSLKHYEVDLNKLVSRLTSFDNYDDIIGALNQAIEDEPRDRIKIPLRKIRNLISDINKAERIYTEDTLKEAGGVAFNGGSNSNIYHIKYGGEDDSEEREEEH